MTQIKMREMAANHLSRRVFPSRVKRMKSPGGGSTRYIAFVFLIFCRPRFRRQQHNRQGCREPDSRQRQEGRRRSEIIGDDTR